MNNSKQAKKDIGARISNIETDHIELQKDVLELFDQLSKVKAIIKRLDSEHQRLMERWS